MTRWQHAFFAFILVQSVTSTFIIGNISVNGYYEVNPVYNSSTGNFMADLYCPQGTLVYCDCKLEEGTPADGFVRVVIY